MSANSPPPEDRRLVAELDEALSVEPAQEQAAELGLGLARFGRRVARFTASLTERERDVLRKRFGAPSPAEVEDRLAAIGRRR